MKITELHQVQSYLIFDQVITTFKFNINIRFPAAIYKYYFVELSSKYLSSPIQHNFYELQQKIVLLLEKPYLLKEKYGI